MRHSLLRQLPAVRCLHTCTTPSHARLFARVTTKAKAKARETERERESDCPGDSLPTQVVASTVATRQVRGGGGGGGLPADSEQTRMTQFAGLKGLKPFRPYSQSTLDRLGKQWVSSERVREPPPPQSLLMVVQVFRASLPSKFAMASL